MLSKLVHPDQTAFIKGGYIGENIRLISDIMEQTRANNTPGILISHELILGKLLTPWNGLVFKMLLKSCDTLRK